MLLDTLTQFDRFGRDLFSSLDGTVGAPVDIRRESDRYVVDVDLPGVDPSSLDVTVEGDALTIRAERSNSRTTEDEGWVLRERSASRFVRRFTLGDDVDVDDIRADYHDGVLSVVVPVAERSRRHRIPVISGTPGRKALSGSSATTGDEQGKAEAAHSQAS